MFVKIRQYFLSILILLSTSGLTISIHSCKSIVSYISQPSSSKKCCMAEKEDTKQHKCCCSNSSNTKKNCKNEVVKVKTVDDFIISSIKYNFKNILSSKIIFSLLFISNSSTEEDILADTVLKRNIIPPPNIQFKLAFLQRYIL